MPLQNKGVKNFALIGAGGYVARRHLQAIKDTGNKLVAAVDRHDSVGLLDNYFFDVDFFTEFERFDRHAEKLRRMGEDNKINYVSICSPNYLHDAHIRFALRMGADAICEKPLVLNPWNLEQLSVLEQESGKKVHTILQLRFHPSIIALKEKVNKDSNEKKYEVDLTYITPRGPWYHHSWKGDISKSGGIATNIGIHFFDMLSWVFGQLEESQLHYSDSKKASGYLEFKKARVRWFLSLDKDDLARTSQQESKPYRSITVNGSEIEFSNVFADLHTIVYENVLKNISYGISDAAPSIELVYNIRNAQPKITDKTKVHPFLSMSD